VQQSALRIRFIFICLFTDTFQRGEGAGLDTGGLQPAFYPFIAAVAFYHPAVGWTELRDVIGTGLITQLTADAPGIITNNKTGMGISDDAVLGTGVDAGGILTVQTGHRAIAIVHRAVPIHGLQRKGLPEAAFPSDGIQIVLVDTRDLAGRTGTAQV